MIALKDRRGVEQQRVVRNLYGNYVGGRNSSETASSLHSGIGLPALKQVNRGLLSRLYGGPTRRSHQSAHGGFSAEIT